MNAYPYFAQNFLLPALAAAFVLVIGTIKHWRAWKRILLALVVFGVAFGISVGVTSHPTHETALILAGTIVEETSNVAVGQARVSIASIESSYVSEDNGNFRIDLTGIAKTERVRVHVSKDGYLPYDATVELPAENFVVRLKHV